MPRAKDDVLTWGEIQAMFKDANPALPLQMMIAHAGGGYHVAKVLGAFVSEDISEGGQLVFVNEREGE